MTTIVATRDRIVSETQVTRDDRITRSDKIFKIDHKGEPLLIGIAGFFLAGILYKDYLSGQNKSYPDLSDAEIVIVHKGQIYVAEGNTDGIVWMPVKDSFYCIGSGGYHATGAMRAGASPEEAVQIACDYDTGSSPPIKCLWIS